MSDSSPVLEDGSTLSRIDRLYFRFETVLTLLGGVVILLLVLLATTNILGRWFFSLPVNGFVDWVEQAMAFFAFLGIAYTQREGGHIRMDIVIGRMHGRLLWALELFTTLLMLAITLLLVYGSYLHFLRAFQIGDSSLDIDLPTWPAKLVVPVALGVLALRLILQCWGFGRALIRGDHNPVAVPRIVAMERLAEIESEHALGAPLAPINEDKS